MNAIQIDRHGGPETLRLVELADPVAGPGELLVRQAAVGVNFHDVYVRSGLYPGTLPVVLGREGAGTVVAAGDGVREFRPGDRVAYVGAPGAYAELVRVRAGDAVPIPAAIDDRTAAAAMLQGMTAHYLAADTHPVGPGDVALVHAAAGGAGNLLVQLAKARGATVVATAGGPQKVALAREAGADHAIDYLAEDFAERTRSLVGDRAVTVAYDSVGKTTWEKSMSLLRPRGMLVLYGNASGPVPPIDPLALMRGGSLFVTRPTLADYVATPAALRARATAVFDAIAAGTLKIRIGAEYPLAGAAQAHRDLEARATVGKLLLIP